MKSFVNVEQPYIAPSIEAFGQAMDNLQQRHDAAVEALSEAQTNIANLDFNTVDKDVQAEMLQKVKDFFYWEVLNRLKKIIYFVKIAMLFFVNFEMLMKHI